LCVFSEIEYCRGTIDNFMMMVGVMLFFSARDHFSYYSNKLVKRVTECFASKGKKKFLFEDLMFNGANPIEEIQQAMKRREAFTLKKIINSVLTRK
jgi:hypothetical protein